MKNLLMVLSVLIAPAVMAQADSLPSGVYQIDTRVAASGAQPAKRALRGSTTDLTSLNAHASTLAPGQQNHPPRALDDVEELVVVKAGHLTIFLNDSSTTLGPGSVALIIAGDRQSFTNSSDQPVTYYVIAFRARLPVNIKRGREAGGSLMKDWQALTEKKTDKGASRPIFDRASSMFGRFDVHATTLNPGFESHPPHTHRQEEMMLLMQGNVTLQAGGTALPATAGDVMLLRPGIIHNVRNTGSEPSRYLAIKWYGDSGK